MDWSQLNINYDGNEITLGITRGRGRRSTCLCLSGQGVCARTGNGYRNWCRHRNQASVQARVLELEWAQATKSANFPQ